MSGHGAGRGGAGLALGAGREFEAIRRWVADAPLPDGVVVGPGDDAAVLEDGWVVSTDLMVEDVHFRSAWATPAEIGFRAVTAALSDLAAMAARPVGVLLSLASGALTEAGLDALNEGARRAAEAAGARVVGGDLAGSPGPLFVDVVVLGRAARPALRTGARPGDELWVTGTLGAAAGAVAAWEDGREPSPAMRAAFVRPTARVEEALWLAEHADVRALIDLSDGLAGDAGHVAAGSGVGAVLEAARVPVAPGLGEAGHDAEAALGFALHGGEDYELLLAVTPGTLDAEAFRAATGTEVTRVGRVEEGEGVWLDDGGGPRRLERGGFDHLGAGA